MERMLKKGDEVVTIAGMYGTVTRIGDDWVELEIAKRTRARFMKRAVASIVTIAEEEEEDEEIIEPEEDEVYEEDETEEGEGADESAEEQEESESPTAPKA
jgi:preprotein translocase subunit YajC